MCIKQRARGILTLPLAAGLTMALAACQGGAVYFEGGASGQVNVNENTTAPVWKAIAKVTGTSSTAGIAYRLRGPDAEQFSVNINGEISFRQAADFEHPLDADKNNEYQIEIEASANTQPAVQSLRITVEDVKKPQVALLQPKPYENVGKGNELEVATRVRVFDAESNTPLNGLAVKQNSMTLQQDATDPSLWKGTILVPEGGVEFPLSAILADGTELTSSAKLLNKRNSVSPEFLGVNPGAYLIFFDPDKHEVGKLVLKELFWEPYFANSSIGNRHNFEFNSSWQTLYASHNVQGTENLFAVKVDRASPTFIVHRGCWPDPITNIVYDYSNKRALIVTSRQEQAIQRFQVVSVATEQTNGFVDTQQIYPLSPCEPISQTIAWDIPVGTIKGTFKDFDYYRIGKLFVLADERVTNGTTTTTIQAFSESGDKRLEVQLGSDPSNIAINNSAGIIYVAEQHSSAAGKIKAIDINTGRVSDLVQSNSGNPPGSYTQLRMDNAQKKLYIADAVSDAFFVVDLTTNNLSELVYKSWLER